MHIYRSNPCIEYPLTPYNESESKLREQSLILKKAAKENYHKELDEWAKKGTEGEDREGAVAEVKAFIRGKGILQLIRFFLTELPPLEFIAEEINLLDVTWNRLVSLPDSLKKMKRLSCLIINNNYDLEELPDLTSLEELSRNIETTTTKITKDLYWIKAEKDIRQAAIAINIIFNRKILKPKLPEKIIYRIDEYLNELLIYLKQLEDWKKEELETRSTMVGMIKECIFKSEKIFDFKGLNCVSFRVSETLPPLEFVADNIEIIKLSSTQLPSFTTIRGTLKNLKELYVDGNLVPLEGEFEV